MNSEESAKNPYKVFHSSSPELRKRIHIVLVRPEQGGNVGSAARALSNMGIEGTFRIVGTPAILDENAQKMAKHARPKFEKIQFYDSLKEALAFEASPRALRIAATARVGSPGRPHPLWVRVGMERAVEKLRSGEAAEIYIVFGPESDGLRNDEVDQCDWVVTIPSSLEYRSLNLAQAILIFSYETHMNLLKEWENFDTGRSTQRDKLVSHMIHLAEEVGFILPGDRFKMKPRLEEIFSALPHHIKGIRTLHGLIDQVSRTVKKGRVDLKGRYKKFGAEGESTPQQ